MEKTIYQKKCPICRKETIYRSKYGYNYSIKHKTKCRTCCGKINIINAVNKRRKYKAENFWETKDKAINYLKEIQENTYVPNFKSMYKIFGCIFKNNVKKFGGYKQLVKEAELKIAGFYKTSDGHIVRSYYEYLFDEFLYLNNIPHKIDGLICNTSKYRYDFKINDIYIEIWGLSINHKHCEEYNKKRQIKENLYKENNLKLISIERSDFQSATENNFKTKLEKEGIVNSLYNDSNLIFQNIKLGFLCDEIIINEIKNIINSLNVFPTETHLKSLGRNDLKCAIYEYGGFKKFQKLLGFNKVSLKEQRKLEKETYALKELNKIQGDIGRFPLKKELKEMGRIDLISIFDYYYSYNYFKNKILGTARVPKGYWDNENNVFYEIKILKDKLGRFPTQKELGIIKKGVYKKGKNIKYFYGKLT